VTYATTFSGIGGWELGLNACGWDLKWQCEREPFCQALLRERFGVPIYDDIRTICEHNPTPVDALIGSPPCQPFSVAGRKVELPMKGTYTLPLYWFLRFAPDGCSWSKCQLSLALMGDEHLQDTSAGWSRSGIALSGTAYQLSPLGCPTAGNESGLLPTLQASDGTFRMIKRKAKLRANGYRIQSNQGIDGNAKLADIAWTLWGGPLNPTFAEAVMGFPLNWTKPESTHSATRSSPKSRISSAKQSTKSKE
jgi:hypothetical protein